MRLTAIGALFSPVVLRLEAQGTLYAVRDHAMPVETLDAAEQRASVDRAALELNLIVLPHLPTDTSGSRPRRCLPTREPAFCRYESAARTLSWQSVRVGPQGDKNA